MFLWEPFPLFYLFPFVFIWVAMMLIHVKKITVPHGSTAARILWPLGGVFLSIGILLLFLTHYAI